MIVVDTTLCLYAIEGISWNVQFTKEVRLYSEFCLVCHNIISLIV